MQAAYEDADWIRSSAAPDVDCIDEEEEEVEVFECVVCDKVFRSEKQLSNHERLVAAAGRQGRGGLSEE